MALADGELHEHQLSYSAVTDAKRGVRQAFCECLEAELETILTHALLTANDESDERRLKKEHADIALQKL